MRDKLKITDIESDNATFQFNVNELDKALKDSSLSFGGKDGAEIKGIVLKKVTLKEIEFNSGTISKNVEIEGLSRKNNVYAVLKDKKSNGTQAQDLDNNKFIKRELNTVDGNVELSNNSFTLKAGQYKIKAKATAYGCGYHQIRLYDETHDMSEYGTLAQRGVYSEVIAYIEVKDTTTFSIGHVTNQSVQYPNGGIAGNNGQEIYTTVEISGYED